MRFPRSWSLRLLTAFVVASLSMPDAAAAFVGPYDVYAQTLSEAEEAQAKGDSEAAVEGYVVAYESLPGPDRATSLGGDLVERVSRLALEAYLDGNRAPQMLEQSRSLLQAHIRDIQRFSPDADLERWRKSLGGIEAALAALDKPQEAPEEEDAEVEPEPVPAVEPSPATAEEDGLRIPDDPAPRDSPAPATIALIASGSIALGGGIAAIAYGGWFLNVKTEDQLAERREDCDAQTMQTPEDCIAPIEETWLPGEKRKAWGWIGSGIALAALGTGLLTAGVVFVVKDKRERTTMILQPGPFLVGGPGAGLSARF